MCVSSIKIGKRINGPKIAIAKSGQNFTNHINLLRGLMNGNGKTNKLMNYDLHFERMILFTYQVKKSLVTFQNIRTLIKHDLSLINIFLHNVNITAG